MSMADRLNDLLRIPDRLMIEGEFRLKTSLDADGQSKFARLGSPFPTESGWWWVREFSMSYIEMKELQEGWESAEWGGWDMYYVIVDECGRVYTRSVLLTTTWANDVDTKVERMIQMAANKTPVDCIGPLVRPGVSR